MLDRVVAEERREQDRHRRQRRDLLRDVRGHAVRGQAGVHGRGERRREPDDHEREEDADREDLRGVLERLVHRPAHAAIAGRQAVHHRRPVGGRRRGSRWRARPTCSGRGPWTSRGQTLQANCAVHLQSVVYTQAREDRDGHRAARVRPAGDRRAARPASATRAGPAAGPARGPRPARPRRAGEHQRARRREPHATPVDGPDGQGPRGGGPRPPPRRPRRRAPLVRRGHAVRPAGARGDPRPARGLADPRAGLRARRERARAPPGGAQAPHPRRRRRCRRSARR